MNGLLSRTEAAGAVLILVLAIAMGVAAVLAHWMFVSVFAATALATAGLVALLGARRARLAAERMEGQLDAQGRQLSGQLAPIARRLVSGGAAGDAGNVRTASAVAAGLPEPIVADDLESYLELAETMPDHRWLDNTILRNASILGRDLLAWRASGRRYRYPRIEHLLEMARDPVRAVHARKMLGCMDVEWTLRLARVVALQALQGNDRLNAFTLYRHVYEEHGPRLIAPSHTHGRLFHALAFELGEYKLAEEIIRKVRCPKSELHFMRADLLNPFTASPFADREAWLKAVNENFVGAGLEPVLMDWEDAAHEPFDLMRAEATDRVADGPLVSVVVSSWQPDHGLRTAVASLIAQSWQPLEILIVDDASPEGYLPLLESVASLDPRIRLVRQPRNGGTYMARNTAMGLARGEFITFLDSDDWNHPRRIEHQVRALLDDPALVCTTSRALRTSPDLVFNFPGVLAQRENASSLMFRLERVRERIGYFDCVRKGADTEYLLRIRQAFGADSHRIIDENLSLIRLTRGSLSRGEFKPGWRHPSRAAYRRSYERWHRSARAPGALLLGPDAAQRRFSAPCRFLVDRDGEEARRRSRFDVAFMLDLRHATTALRAALDEARACRRQGLSVAFVHAESFRHFARVEMEPFWEPLQQALCNGEFEELLLTDAATVERLVVRDPEVLQFHSRNRSGLTVGRVAIVADEPPRSAAGDLWYEPSACSRHARDMFDTWVTWVPRTLRARRALAALVPRSETAAEGLPVVVDPASWAGPPKGPGRRSPVIGRISGGCLREWPSGPQALLSAYPADARYDVRFMGGREQCERLLGYRPIPDNWTFHDPRDTSHGAFLAACDFFVYFDRGGGNPEAPRAVLEAMAAGCVVILHIRYAGIFGDAAVYCEAAGVPAVIDDFASDPGKYRLQSGAGRRFVEDAFRPDRYVESLATALR